MSTTCTVTFTARGPMGDVLPFARLVFVPDGPEIAAVGTWTVPRDTREVTADAAGQGSLQLTGGYYRFSTVTSQGLQSARITVPATGTVDLWQLIEAAGGDITPASVLAAQQAVTDAQAAADSILNLTVSASGLGAGVPPTASYDPLTGNMAFGIPKGDQGDKGDKGDPGGSGPVYSEISEAEIDTGTASTERAITARRITYVLGKAATAAQGAKADTAVQPAAIAQASAAEIQGLTTTKLMSPSVVATALVAATPSGGSNWTPDWSAFICAEWVITANRTLSNPTNVVPGTTRAVTVKSSSATEFTMAFGSNFKGSLPVVKATNAAFVTLFLFAVSATQILVSDKAWT